MPRFQEASHLNTDWAQVFGVRQVLNVALTLLYIVTVYKRTWLSIVLCIMCIWNCPSLMLWSVFSVAFTDFDLSLMLFAYLPVYDLLPGYWIIVIFLPCLVYIVWTALWPCFVLTLIFVPLPGFNNIDHYYYYYLLLLLIFFFHIQDTPTCLEHTWGINQPLWSNFTDNRELIWVRLVILE